MVVRCDVGDLFRSDEGGAAAAIDSNGLACRITCIAELAMEFLVLAVEGFLA